VSGTADRGSQFTRYVAAAVGSAAADWVVFAGALWLGAWHLHAQAVARMAGGLFSFVANRLWSFEGGGAAAAAQARRFVALYAISYGLSLSMLYVLADVLGVNAYTSKLSADGACFLFNFAVMRSWVFRPAVD
jgi:putative flippase GtrA